MWFFAFFLFQTVSNKRGKIIIFVIPGVIPIVIPIMICENQHHIKHEKIKKVQKILYFDTHNETVIITY